MCQLRQPEGYVVEGKENNVYKVKKSVHELKQSPRQWYKRFNTLMIGHEYTRSMITMYTLKHLVIDRLFISYCILMTWLL